MENVNNKSEEIYKIIEELKKGTLADRSLAFECIGILGNESTNETLEGKLEIVEELIKEYFSSKNN